MKEYKNDKGELHRLGGPAIEWADGGKSWYKDGKCHRIDGPACEWADEYKAWYIEGKRHRLDGPAIEWANGDKSWYIEGVEYTEEEFKGKTNGIKPDPVNHPSHYKEYPKEVFDIIKYVLGEEGYKAYCIGNEIKYRLRCGLKDPNKKTEDIEKAMVYYKERKNL